MFAKTAWQNYQHVDAYMGHYTEAYSNYITQTASIFLSFPGSRQEQKNPCFFTISLNEQNIINYVQIGSI